MHKLRLQEWWLHNGAGAAKRSYPMSKVGEAAERSYPTSKVRGGGREELPRI